MVNPPSTQPDFSALTEVTDLPDTTIEQAVRLCQSVSNSDDQWDCYLRSLALLGVRHWLAAGSTPYDIRFNDRMQPDQTPVLQVNGLRVGVVPVGSLPPEAANIPQSTVQGSAPIHLWLLVEVQEELAQIRVVGALEGRQVAARATAVTPIGDYTLPLTAFTLPPDRALFYLSHLSPEAAATSATPPVAAISLGDRVMNVGRWLQNQLDEVAQQLSWTLLDPLTPAGAMRSPTQELEAILTDLEPQGLFIPERARAAFTEVQVAAVPLRLYALTWSIFESSTPEWSLLVFLGPSPGEMLPPGLTFRVRDAEAVLAEETFSAQSAATYLYAQVIGTWNETFSLEILPPNSRDPLTLPAFGFQPDT